ncbi:BA75_02578T0 [Komagataella pastoris]|uniref:BA75_02578T0 n=1 Tax=Komagataella pastoris TaxID=4922 RepID=A0A1B2JCM1_PICPA|nr:BA75_02578T0 [Komagataella pastoris]
MDFDISVDQRLILVISYHLKLFYEHDAPIESLMFLLSLPLKIKRNCLFFSPLRKELRDLTGRIRHYALKPESSSNDVKYQFLLSKSQLNESFLNMVTGTTYSRLVSMEKVKSFPDIDRSFLFLYDSRELIPNFIKHRTKVIYIGSNVSSILLTQCLAEHIPICIPFLEYYSYTPGRLFKPVSADHLQFLSLTVLRLYQFPDIKSFEIDCPNLKSLDISFGNIEVIKGKFENLKSLKLAHCTTKTFDLIAPKMKTIIIHFSNVHNVHGIFPSMSVCDLYSNSHQRLSMQAPCLESLTLSKIQRLESFYGSFPCLEAVDLEGSKDLKQLVTSEARIQKINANGCTNLFMSYFLVDGNRLPNEEPPRHVDVLKGNFTHLKSMSLNYVPVSSINIVAPQLENLSLKGTPLVDLVGDLRDLKELNLDNCTAFQTMISHAAPTRMKVTFTEDMDFNLNGYSHVLKHLSINETPLACIEYTSKSLVQLSLKGCHNLISLKGQMENIKRLDLSSSSLLDFEIHAPSLEMINLSKTSNLKMITGYFPNLQKLDLSYSAVESISVDAFQLRKIIIFGEDIPIVKVGSYPNLKTVYISPSSTLTEAKWISSVGEQNYVFKATMVKLEGASELFHKATREKFQLLTQLKEKYIYFKSREICYVCQEEILELESVFVLNCGHFMHYSCTMSYFQEGFKACSICNQKMIILPEFRRCYEPFNHNLLEMTENW